MISFHQVRPRSMHIKEHVTGRWSLRPSAACLCGAPEQTADHILSECTMLGPPLGSPTDLTNPCPETVDWLRQLREVVLQQVSYARRRRTLAIEC